MILADTNVISEAMRPDGDARVKAAVARWNRDIFLSVVVMGELLFGIELLPEGRRKVTLRAYYEGLKADHADRVLDVTEGIAERWGAMRAAHQRAGRRLPLADGLIAATAIEHDLTLMTRNTADFAFTGARLLNPWED